MSVALRSTSGNFVGLLDRGPKLIQNLATWSCNVAMAADVLKNAKNIGVQYGNAGPVAFDHATKLGDVEILPRCQRRGGIGSGTLLSQGCQFVLRVTPRDRSHVNGRIWGLRSLVWAPARLPRTKENFREVRRPDRG
jgi:hypothetical protein